MSEGAQEAFERAESPPCVCEELGSAGPGRGGGGLEVHV
jgi:hypothetical protein